MLELIITLVLASAVVLYAVLGGADFGAGMVEFLVRKRDGGAPSRLVSHALAPVWEANHIWLILAVVILFTAFPRGYAEISTVFHLPLIILLLGIVARGCAFVFRHYDPHPDESSRYFTPVFYLASFLAPFAEGLIAGALLLGRIPSDQNDFVARYVLPWANFFSATVGLFMCGLCVLLAATFLLGETNDAALRQSLARTAKRSGLIVAALGVSVFLVAPTSGFSLWSMFHQSSVSLTSLLAAGVCSALWWRAVSQSAVFRMRFLAGLLVSLVLLGWFAATYPYIIGGHPDALYSLSLREVIAPPATQRVLVWALGLGFLLIAPSLTFLFLTFKRSPTEGE